MTLILAVYINVKINWIRARFAVCIRSYLILINNDLSQSLNDVGRLYFIYCIQQIDRFGKGARGVGVYSMLIIVNNVHIDPLSSVSFFKGSGCAPLASIAFPIPHPVPTPRHEVYI